MSAHTNTPSHQGPICSGSAVSRPRTPRARKAGFAVAVALVMALGAGGSLAAMNALCVSQSAQVQATRIAPAKLTAAPVRTAWIQAHNVQEMIAEDIDNDEDNASMWDRVEEALMNVEDNEMDEVQDA
ncbi:MAG: hypothetical protein Q4B54_02140 [Coriobacteriales bacterium]|nr:hypothetical protein [Coriobacteriales bacterium]